MKPPRIAPPPTRYGPASPGAAQPAGMPAARFGTGSVPPPPTRFGPISPQQPLAAAQAPASLQPSRTAVPPPMLPAIVPNTVQPSLAGRGAKKPRPSREERDKARFAALSLKKTDKKGRTRAGKKTIAELQLVLGKPQDEIRRNLLAEARKNTPPKNLGKYGTGGAIYSGKWRGFEETFETNWWTTQGPAPWTCCICHAPILANATGRNGRSIEHRQPWSVLKTEIATQIVCKDGVHWEVALTSDVRDVLQDVNNLEPAHKGCNSSKGGTKNTDSIAPIKRGDCPGTGCDASKAI